MELQDATRNQDKGLPGHWKRKAGFPRRARMPRSQSRVPMPTRLAPSRLSLGENLSAGSLAGEAKASGRFEGSFLEASGASRIWNREKFGGGSKHRRSEEAACSHTASAASNQPQPQLHLGLVHRIPKPVHITARHRPNAGQTHRSAGQTLVKCDPTPVKLW